MRALKIARAAAVIAAGFATAVQAADKKTKAAPGKCGVGMFYDMKAKTCAAK